MGEDQRQLLFTEFFNQKLKERGLTLRQLSEISGINLKYLELLSHGRFEQLPPSPYLHGYFRRLGEILGFDPSEWWERVKDGGSLKASGKGDVMAENRFARGKKGLWITGAVLIVLLIFFGVRASKILGEPQIELTAPASDLPRVTEDHVIFEGKITNADELTINDQQVQHEDDGSFRTEVPLQPGENRIEVKAKKVLGRETKITREVYYDASESFIPQAGGAKKGVSSPPATSSAPSSTSP
jgi:cytoskeletal protein RodZ